MSTRAQSAPPGAFTGLDLDAIDASPGVAKLGGRTVRLGALSAAGFKAIRRMQATDDLTSAQYEADETFVVAEVFPDLTAAEREAIPYAQQAFALARAFQASNVAYLRAIEASAERDAEGNGSGPGVSTPARSTAARTST